MWCIRTVVWAHSQLRRNTVFNVNNYNESNAEILFNNFVYCVTTGGYLNNSNENLRNYLKLCCSWNIRMKIYRKRNGWINSSDF